VLLVAPRHYTVYPGRAGKNLDARQFPEGIQHLRHRLEKRSQTSACV